MTVARSTPVRRSRTPIMRIWGEWVFALFLAGYYKAAPWLGFIQTHVDITLLFLILSVLAFSLHVVRKSFKIKMPLGFTKVAVLFLLLTACLLGGLLYTPSRQYGFDKALRFIFLTGWAFFGAALLISDFLSLKRFSWALVTISTAMSIDALLAYPGVGQVSFVTALGSNYIALARASGLGLLATVVFLLPTERRPLVKLCLWIVVALQLWAVLSAGARGPIIALILSFLLFFALSVRGFLRLRIDRFALRLGVITLIVGVVLVGIGEEFFPTLWYRTNILIESLGTSAEERLFLNQVALDEWVKSPMWGAGTGSFGLAAREMDIREYPHNIILELGTENGLIGVFVVVIMIVIAFANGFSCLRREDKIAKVVARYLLTIGCFALLNAMVSGDIGDNRILFSLVGLIAAAPRFQRGVVGTRLSDAKEVQR